ncbi:MAG: coenzyme F420-0:L-glutamate ligase [Anaerolineaceae bacterium]|jgi:coenzyme F420-0:L-glutamate ligase/coenzyme F420-1:gamma-L-glutamate ligase|nr:coenzyme F420-0:L-glutamate ligase [Anaerolineaceae bacterium]MDD4041906.1 coenzyme F420-0:L-glutamate ligase [Anaerolineaceae bacterium]MDD4578440.1 coenzyme F420-0:L-glutamate ligase [Anaerolineaceae bacterium]
MNQTKQLILTAVAGIPIVQDGDNLAEIIYQAMLDSELDFKDGDVLVLAQKIVSKAEGRLVNLSTVTPSAEAVELAAYLEKRPELVELILQESSEILRTRPGTIIVQHKAGFVCANAGIDHSNVKGPWGDDADWVLLLPEDSDKSAARIRKKLEEKTGKRLAVLIIDSHGRAWRNGVLGTAIGVSGMPGLVDMRGTEDMNGYKMRVTTIAAADELAASSSLIMGQTSESTPVVHARGFPYGMREGSVAELIRDKEKDMFR